MARSAIQLDALRREIFRLEGAASPAVEGGVVTTGYPPLDRLLAQGGVLRGSLVEWLADADGTGAETLALATAREACRQGGTLVVVDRRREFYPPEAARWGIATDRLILVYPTGEADNAWAIDQALRSRGVAAVMAWPDRPAGKPQDMAFRRMQLAAERSGAIGLLIRPASVQSEPSWAAVRWLVEPLAVGQAFQPDGAVGQAFQPDGVYALDFARQAERFPCQARKPDLRGAQRRTRRLRIRLLRCRGGTGGQSVDLELDDETHTVRLVAELADPARPPRAAGV